MSELPHQHSRHAGRTASSSTQPVALPPYPRLVGWVKRRRARTNRAPNPAGAEPRQVAQRRAELRKEPDCVSDTIGLLTQLLPNLANVALRRHSFFLLGLVRPALLPGCGTNTVATF